MEKGRKGINKAEIIKMYEDGMSVKDLLVQDIESAERRAIALRNAGVDVFAQPYRDFENKIEPTKQMKALARWVNRKEVFKSVERFAEYTRRVSK